VPSFPRSQRKLPTEDEDGEDGRVSHKDPNAKSEFGAVIALGVLGTSPRPTVRPTFATHRRKVKVLRTCTRMVLQDLDALEGCIEAIEAIGLDNSVFENVQHLSLGPDLTWALGRNIPVAYNGREALSQMFSPRHLCLHFHIGDTRYLYTTSETLRRPPYSWLWTGCYQDLREGAILSICASLAESLIQAWEIESITLHDRRESPRSRGQATPDLLLPDTTSSRSACPSSVYDEPDACGGDLRYHLPPRRAGRVDRVRRGGRCAGEAVSETGRR
jgi:hypothetical protein